MKSPHDGSEQDPATPNAPAPEAEPPTQVQSTTQAQTTTRVETDRLPHWILGGVLVLLLAYPVVRWVSGSRDATLPATSPAADAGLLQASFDLYRAGRYPEAIAAAQAAVKQNPNLAAAY
jgi:hypothetical protein